MAHWHTATCCMQLVANPVIFTSFLTIELYSYSYSSRESARPQCTQPATNHHGMEWMLMA